MRINMKKLILLLLVALTAVTYAAKKNEKKLFPLKLDVKISNFGIEPGVVYVFTDRNVALKFKKYGQKCLVYKDKNPTLYKKSKEKLAKLLEDKMDKVFALNPSDAKLLLIRWSKTICKVEFTREIELSYGDTSSETQRGYLATLDTYRRPVGC